MKKGKVLNEHISRAIASMGHGDIFVIADAGLAVPKSVEKIDVSVGENIPGFLETVKIISQELCVDKIIIPNQLEDNKELFIANREEDENAFFIEAIDQASRISQRIRYELL